ncbi:MAG: hypothetical protein HY872_16980 [Chloroflexi bacterium]|nr:hypothetical protein [Chloroflexota bacterium]MBI5293572.1 hypothetical protein [Chloroflexota bacterium]
MEMMTVQLPKRLFERLERAAKRLHRPVDEYIIQSLDLSIPPELPVDWQAELEEMLYFNDEKLRQAAEPLFSPNEQKRLRELNYSAGERELTDAEQKEADALLEKYHFSTVRRARALAVLKMRGFALPLDQPPLELDRA